MMDRNYELIRKFKATTSPLHDSSIDLSEKNVVLYKVKEYFGAKSKVMMQQWKK